MLFAARLAASSHPHRRGNLEPAYRTQERRRADPLVPPPRAGPSGLKPVKLAFCSHLLCVVPYVVAAERGFFEDEGLAVELVHTRGGGAALQALVGGAVDYAATSLDAALLAYTSGAPIRRFATTGRLPLFALAVAPREAERIRSVADLAGKTVGVAALGNADHALVLYLLNEAGIPADQVAFATVGPNLFEALRVGHVDAGMVQEPALTLVEAAGGKVLVNFMNLEHAQQHLGGAYEFMGVSYRAAERAHRLDEMRRLGRALQRALEAIHELPGSVLVQAMPDELIVGGDRELFAGVLERHRRSLYPTTIAIDAEAVDRVVVSQQMAGLLPPAFNVTDLLDLEVLGA